MKQPPALDRPLARDLIDLMEKDLVIIAEEYLHFLLQSSSGSLLVAVLADLFKTLLNRGIFLTARFDDGQSAPIGLRGVSELVIGVVLPAFLQFQHPGSLGFFPPARQAVDLPQLLKLHHRLSGTVPQNEATKEDHARDRRDPSS